MSIRAYVGMNGSGKSLAVVEQMVLPAWRKGRLVVSNMTLLPEALGFSPDLFQPLTNTAMIPGLGTCQQPDPCPPDGRCPHSTTGGRPCVVVFDEIGACFPSRSFSTLPPEVARKLNQLRKADVTLAWTAPSWKRCDTILRECTISVTLCKGLWNDRYERRNDRHSLFPRALRDDAGRRIKVKSDWLPHRVFLWRTFDAQAFEEFSTDKVEGEKLRPVSSDWYWRSRHDAHRGYRTLESVNLLDHVDEFGVCMTCRGNRKRPPCSCSDSGPREPKPPARAAQAPLLDPDVESGVVRMNGRSAA